MRITLEHTVSMVDGADPLYGWRSLETPPREIVVIVDHDVTYHYDAGGWMNYGGDPPSFSLDVNESEVVDWRTTDGSESAVLAKMTREDIQKVYDAWEQKHSEEVEAKLFDAIQDGAGEPDYD